MAKIQLLFLNDDRQPIDGEYAGQRVTLLPGFSLHAFQIEEESEASFLFGPGLAFGASKPWTLADSGSLYVIAARALDPEEGGGMRQFEAQLDLALGFLVG